MKKITLLVLALVAFQFNYAQDTCATATAVSSGTTTVAAVNGTEVPNPECAANEGGTRTAGEWFSFTASADGVINITTDIAANAGGDTRLHVYSGGCGALTCLTGNDDVSDTNFLSEVTFAATSGTTYIFAFDDRWSAAGFDFVLTETVVTCNYSEPFTETYDDNNQFLVCFTTEDGDGDGISWISQQDLDLDGDSTPETFATNGNSTANAKDDWLFSPALTLTGGTTYDVTTIFNTFSGNGNFEAFIVPTPSSTATPEATLFSNTNIAPMGDFATLETMAYNEVNSFTPAVTGDYHIAYHSFGAASSGFILLFDSNLEESLSVDEFEANAFTKTYNKANQTLILESSNMAFTNIDVYSILGQKVISMPLANTTETISVSSLNNGVYLAKVSINGNSKTIKFIKN